MKYRSSSEGKGIVKQDYSKKIIFSLDDFDENGHLLQVVTIPPHSRQKMHSHEKQTEVFYIGEATITINGVEYLVKPGDVRNVRNKTKEDFRLVVSKINLPGEGEDSHWQE